MKKGLFLLFLIGLCFSKTLFAHEVNYQVKGAQGVCVSFFFAGGEPMDYAEIEVYVPEEKIPFQKARTDRNGIFCFMPDKKGVWKVIAKGETEHGLHGAEVEVKVKEDLSIEGFKKPLVATYTKFFIAFGIVGWLFSLAGIYWVLRKRKI
uniref:Nickel transport protein n=1 Tax=Thermodesulfobacterium geofontis TaxID=1295609 RepID=A0A7C4NTG9_9BACT